MRPARRPAALAIAVLALILLTTISDTVYDKQNQLPGLNGQIIATSEAYHRKESALNGIHSVQENAPTAEIDDQTGE